MDVYRVVYGNGVPIKIHVGFGNLGDVPFLQRYLPSNLGYFEQLFSKASPLLRNEVLALGELSAAPSDYRVILTHHFLREESDEIITT